MRKAIKRVADKTLGVPMRAFMRNCIVNPLFRLNYKTTIVGSEHAFSCTDGAIVVSNHVSYMDGPFLMNEAWPFARMRATTWYKEYKKHRFLMWLFSVVPLGSPSELHEDERARRKKNSMDIMNRILRASQLLLIFAEGSIGDGATVKVDQRLTGVHDLIHNNPDKPILMVRIEGLERSHFGRVKDKSARRGRLPVTITIERFDNVSLDGGCRALNERIAQYFNDRKPIPTVERQIA